MPTPIARTWSLLELVGVSALDMDVLYPTPWLIFRRENSMCTQTRIHCLLTFCDSRQKNMDYCISNALSYNSEGLPEAAVIYDLACQWGVHFQARMERSTTMTMPTFDKLITAVGKFHLGSHVEKCFYRHSLNFIEGTGQVDGEIIETLWSGLNPISAMARSMTKAHRQEVMDAATRDWNWKKLTGVGKLSLPILLQKG